MSEAGIERLSQFLKIIDELPDTYIPFRDDVYKNDNMVNLILNFQQDLELLKNKKELIESDVIFSNIPSEVDLELMIFQITESSLLSWFDPRWYKMKKTLSLFFNQIPKNDAVLLSKLKLLLDYVQLKNSIEQDKKYRYAFKNLFQGTSTDISKIQIMGDWYQKVIKTYGIGFGQTTIITEEIFSLPQDVFRGIKQLINNGILNTIFNICSSLNRLRKLYPKFKGIQNENLNIETDIKLKELESTLHHFVKTIQSHLLDPDSSQSDIYLVIDLVNELEENQISINENDINTALFNNNLLLEFDFNKENDFDTVIKLKEYFDDLQEGKLSPLQLEIISNLNAAKIKAYRDESKSLVSIIKQFQNALSDFNSLINNQTWASQHSIHEIHTKIKYALENKAYLDGWLKFLYAKEKTNTDGLELFSEEMISKNWDMTYTENSLLFLIYRNLSASIYDKNSYIAKKSGQEQEGIRKEFSRLDEELKSIQRKRVASLASNINVPQGSRGTRVSEYTQDFLVKHELNKKTRHIAIRSLIKRAGKAIQAYKPCFMMSPMAAAKFIEPGKLEFDLVIMDEASQVKQEFALSCFARGKQVVVVGDPKQLPPTDFFEKSTSNEDEEDEAVITDSESILEAISGFTPKRMLKWHYRSKHESLIAFSNHQFYDSRLIVFPSPYNESDEFGIKLQKINDGVFENGFNPAEAEQVVEGIINHLRSGSTDSLGVVTMNAKQKEHIENLLEMAITTNPDLLPLYNKDKSRPDPIFVKNLENVQGDERDIIVISFTYGSKTISASSIPQRFGPINNANGWRRLNVLFTRSKKKMIIYSSMSSTQIVPTENSSRGVHALKDFLAYAESGQMPTNTNITGKAPDSDFEVAVISRLESSGFECVPQVGVGGYFIDIAVRNPNSPGEFIMGIECDGATYHSSKSSRDRDKVRQGVLEGLGWNIQRIWSTDWFKNQEAELAPIIKELKRLSSL